MDDLLELITRHGYLLLAALAFIETIGLPVPAALAFLTAGAASAYGILNPFLAFGSAFLAMLIGDMLMYSVGKYSGWALLGVLCRLSANPETCILRSAEYFYKRGKRTLLFAKFIPGVNTMSPPLAGSMRMQTTTFLTYDAIGTTLYVLTYGALGYTFSHFLKAITQGLRTAGVAMEVVLGVGIVLYALYRIYLYRKYRVYGLVPRVSVDDLAQTVNGDPRPMIVDVRSHGYYDAGTERIHGSIRIEPNNLEEEAKNLPREREIYLYCT